MAEDIIELDEHPIYLNDLLRLDVNSKEFKNGKFYFNLANKTGNEDSRLKTFSQNPKELNFSLYAYTAGKDGKKKVKRFNEDTPMLISAIEMQENVWLLARVCKVLKIYEDKPADVEDIPEYEKWVGRVVFEFKNGQYTQPYICTTISQCKVVRLLPSLYSGEPFPGYENVHIKMRELRDMLNPQVKSYAEEWRTALRQVKAVYCLYDVVANKFYIGSAYNNNGCLLSRWEDYLTDFDGGNVKLKVAKEEKGEDYFLDNFYFSILETFPVTTIDQKIMDRERHWKDVFNSLVPNGYNAN